jgi:hypothetical protein
LTLARPISAIHRLGTAADAALRGQEAPPWRTIAVLVAAGFCYGAAMGAYTYVGPPRTLQVLYSAIKVPLLLGVSFALSLPSFFVLNTLAGLHSDFPRVLRALAASQAGITLVLASLAPFTLLWYASSRDHGGAILFNGAMFAIASITGQRLLHRGYRPLIAANPRHGWFLRLWFVLYAFVGIQMGWVLRPFVGTPGTPMQFFREDSWGNAYVVVWGLIWNAVGR